MRVLCRGGSSVCESREAVHETIARKDFQQTGFATGSFGRKNSAATESVHVVVS